VCARVRTFFLVKKLDLAFWGAWRRHFERSKVLWTIQSPRENAATGELIPWEP